MPAPSRPCIPPTVCLCSCFEAAGIMLFVRCPLRTAPWKTAVHFHLLHSLQFAWQRSSIISLRASRGVPSRFQCIAVDLVVGLDHWRVLVVVHDAGRALQPGASPPPLATVRQPSRREEGLKGEIKNNRFGVFGRASCGGPSPLALRGEPGPDGGSTPRSRLFSM